MLALSLIIFVGILYIATTLITTSSIQVNVDAAYRAVQDIKESADFIYVHGHPSRIQTNIRIPSNVENITLNNKLIRLRVSVGSMYTDIYAIARGNITSNLGICSSGICREGNYLFVFTSTDPATGYDVNITVV
ncbi:MAG: hypothetical protein DRO90_02975 [Candidatus Altiarchaeales archaeon]|nr:MAG: hypothetical protein DRO90_02975 [Candidatus Altiarchaeales archaeon]